MGLLSRSDLLASTAKNDYYDHNLSGLRELIYEHA